MDRLDAFVTLMIIISLTLGGLMIAAGIVRLVQIYRDRQFMKKVNRIIDTYGHKRNT